MNPQDIMEAKEIAELLRIKVKTIQDGRWIQKSGCPIFKNGRKFFGIRKEIDAWYKARMRYV